ncbi:helix-turn-helix domain-containing protein [Corynebacterium auriscanis]|uniref:Helix-turn-helix domain-containing protein n=1 Tax=Corynebacterium auriscanis TaxID=99807 RepID=A0A0A2DG21_9CORY|nr:helix-turn-helix domain-containing protein [Corynebacterium auriscanis]KGM18128.1 hypothetical protein MA47_09490 [Corynebacterium auriscanis]WJY73190.1 Helix-turn-helix domain protein [Corynebacterium auriscanis]
MTRETYTLVEAAQRLGVSQAHIYGLAKNDELPFPVIRIGHRYLVPAEAFDRLIRTGEKEPAHQ